MVNAVKLDQISRLTE